MAAGKTKIIFVDESGKEIPFYTTALPPEFQGKEGKKYQIIVKEEGKARVPAGEYVVQGETTTPPPVEECPEGQHKDASGNCVPDEIPPVEDCPPGQHKDASGNCVPDTPIPDPNPQDVLWDSNTDGKWDNGVKRLVDDSEGDIGPNGKGIHMEASGDPVLEIMGDGSALLRCKPGHGRFYVAACNYDAQLEMEFNIMSPGVDDISDKLDSRHQMGGAPENRFGGYGGGTSLTDTGLKREDYHNVHNASKSQDLPKKLELNKWYKSRLAIKHVDGEVIGTRWLDYNDGAGWVKVLDYKDPNPIAPALDKAKIMAHSEFWIRMNNEANGIIALKNVRLTAL